MGCSRACRAVQQGGDKGLVRWLGTNLRPAAVTGWRPVASRFTVAPSRPPSIHAQDLLCCPRTLPFHSKDNLDNFNRFEKSTDTKSILALAKVRLGERHCTAAAPVGRPAPLCCTTHWQLSLPALVVRS